MASPCRLVAVGPAEALPAALDAAEAEVRRIEARYSRYREDSVVSRINAGAGAPQAVSVDDETAGLLRFAEQLRVESGGRFDIRSGVLRRAWDFSSGRLPDKASLAAALAAVQAGPLMLDGCQVRLPQRGMEIDLGGIGKEYAADRAAAVLADAGACGGLVDLGGDLRVLGPAAGGAGWRLGIGHPRQPGATIAELELRQGALATSGDYERFMVVAGRRYCHILDPRSGWPAAQWQSVSVLAPTCLAAGALCTVAMLMGDDAPDFLRQQRVPALLVDAAGRQVGVEWGG